METDSSLAWRFPLRRIPLNEAADLLRASFALYRAAPLRLIGMFLLVWFPIALAFDVDTVGPFLAEVIGALAFTGYTLALDGAGRSEKVDLRQLTVALRFETSKLLLLVFASLVPTLGAFGVLCAVWGYQDTANFMIEWSKPNGQPLPVMALDLRTADYVASMPFTFVWPVWALYRWSGSRSMSANLLACVVNWRWVLIITAFQAVTDSLLIWLRGLSDEMMLVAGIGVILQQMLEVAFTLVLAQRTLPAR